MWRMTPAPVSSARTFVSPASTRQASWLRPVVSQLETRREWPSRRRERWSSIVRVSLALPKGCELLSSDVRCRQPGAIGPRFADARQSSSNRHPEGQIGSRAGWPSEVSTNDKTLPYIEMEVLGPLVRLEPGEETSYPETWALAKLSHPIRRRADVMGMLRRVGNDHPVEKETRSVS